MEVSPESVQVGCVPLSKRVEHSYRLKPGGKVAGLWAFARNAGEYGCRQGVILGGSGYRRAQVSRESVQVDCLSLSKRVEHSFRLKPAER